VSRRMASRSGASVSVLSSENGSSILHAHRYREDMAWSEDAAQALTETFDGSFGAPGVVIAAACVDEAGTATSVSPGDTPAGGRFEIGSVTKTMTATLLALLEADGKLRLDDEIGRWLSAGANGGITLRQLATHTSGLPRLAPNMDLAAADPDNPWAGFGFERAEEGLRQATVAPGTPWLYSNLGYHLLGLVLERASGQCYQALVTGQLLEPLAMTCSGVGDSGGGTPLPGHANGGEVPHWDQPLGAGGIEATIGDLARYARACLRPPDTPLGAAITAALTPQVPIAIGGWQALAWRVRDDGICAHGGGTGGFSSVVLINQGRDRAVTMLISCGPPYGAALGQAGLLALAGDDPRSARPQPPGPEWDDRAREVVQLLLDGRTADVHARASAEFQSRISAEQIERAWRGRTRDFGPAGEVTVRCQGPSGLVAADATIAFAAGTVALRIGFNPSGEIAGLRLLRPKEEQPPLPD
jgi:CubicO group peptidase (beta-lactamase class C family)